MKHSKEWETAKKLIRRSQRHLGWIVAEYFFRHGRIELTPPMEDEIATIQRGRDTIKELQLDDTWTDYS